MNPALQPATLQSRSGLADALFSTTQQRVLGLLFEQPERSFFATEIIALAGSGSGAVQRELKRLTESGLVVVTRVGNQKHYQADRTSPIYSELSGIIGKTVGLAQPLREVLEMFTAQIRVAFIYTSTSKRGNEDKTAIELHVIGHRLDHAEVTQALLAAQAQLGREVKLAVYMPQEWTSELASKDEREKIFLLGAALDLQ